jgi:hypothetical protein
MLETKIELLTAAVVQLTIAIEQASKLKPIVDQVAERIQTTAAPVAAPVPVAPPAPVAAPVPVMPPPPVFASAPTPAANALPFSDANTLVAYVMGVYRQIGAAKGAGIQTVLTSLGAANLTDVKPEQYAAFHAGIEALKA